MYFQLRFVNFKHTQQCEIKHFLLKLYYNSKTRLLSFRVSCSTVSCNIEQEIKYVQLEYQQIM